MIREMRPEDLDETARLEEQCFSEPWSRLLLREALESDLDKLWVISEGECLVGYCNFRVIAGEGELIGPSSEIIDIQISLISVDRSKEAIISKNLIKKIIRF